MNVSLHFQPAADALELILRFTIIFIHVAAMRALLAGIRGIVAINHETPKLGVFFQFGIEHSLPEVSDQTVEPSGEIRVLEIKPLDNQSGEIRIAVEPRVEDAIDVGLDSALHALHKQVVASATDFQALLLAFGRETGELFVFFFQPVDPVSAEQFSVGGCTQGA